MKRSHWILLFITAATSACAGWLLARSGAHNATAPSSSGRKVSFYQSSMHPWIKSDRPGQCTICGMPLTPVYEGESGLVTASDIVSLSSNNITVLNVQTTPVKRGPLKRTLNVAGILEDDASMHRILSAYVEGRIEKLFVHYPGAEVVEGQPLAVFHSPALLVLQRDYTTLHRQWESANPANKPEMEKLKQAAAQRLRLHGLTLKQIESFEKRSDDEHLFEILAPMNGTVVTREVYAGQSVNQGDKLFEIGDFSTLWFQFDAYERDLPWLKPGLTVDVTAPSVPGKSFPSSIRFIDPNMNSATRTVKVRVEIRNPFVEESGPPRRLLVHRSFAEGRVQLDAPDVLLLSRRAVLNTKAHPLVYVDKGHGQYQQRNVQLGRAGDEDWEVLSGLEIGEAAVTQGNLMIDSQAQLNASHEPSSQ